MTNIAFQDIAGGSIRVYSAHPTLPKWERLQKALRELENTGCVKIYLYKGRKLRLIKRKSF